MKTPASRALASLVAAALCLAAFVQPAAAQANRYLENRTPRDWTFIVDVNIRAYQEPLRSDAVPQTDTWTFDTLAVVFPVPERSASHEAQDVLADRARTVKGTLKFNGRTIDEKPTFITQLYHSGTRLARWQGTKLDGRELDLSVEMRVRSYNTVYNEEAANTLPWPARWPEVAQSTFKPQYYIDQAPDGTMIDMKDVKALVDRWTGGDAKKRPPAVGAKWIAHQLISNYQISGNGLGFNRSGALEGIDLQGAWTVARTMRGSEFDMVCLLVALYRQAGIPARTVIGYMAQGDDPRFLRRGGSGSGKNITAWAEFALYDEGSNTLAWIPVDVVRIRKQTSRPPPIERPIKYFGTHDLLNASIPFAFTFHPPTTVKAYGSPGFWGWLATPAEPSRATQGIRFRAFQTPKTAEEQRRDREEQNRQRDR